MLLLLYTPNTTHEDSTSGAATTMEAPQIPPELWNLVMVVMIGGLVAWVVRLTQVLFTYLDVKLAVGSDAVRRLHALSDTAARYISHYVLAYVYELVLHLKHLGPSLSTLKCASLTHFQQILQTKVEASASKMKRVVVPFEIVTSSIHLSRSVDQSSGRVTTLSFQYRTNVACSIQVLWGVHSEIIDRLTPPDVVDVPDDAISRHKSPVLKRLSVDSALMRVRRLPALLSKFHGQTRLHKLQEEEVEQAQVPEGASHYLAGPHCQAQSHVQRLNSPGAGQFSAVIPHHAVEDFTDEIQDLVDEVDNHSRARQSERHQQRLATPQFDAVIVIRAARGSQHGVELTSVTCQCVVVDFLRVPLKVEKLNPVVVKKVNYTPNEAYVSQDIFGRDVGSDGECAICLEGTASVVLLPCRHFCICRVCLEEIDRCPICRTKFSSYMCYVEAVETLKSSIHDRLHLKLLR